MSRRVGARAMCVWLGTLASWRPGLINGLVREYRTMGTLVERPPAEIVEFASRRPSARAGTAASSPSREPRPPSGRRTRRASRRRCARVRSACLRRAERRPPGELVVAWSEALYPDQLRDLGDPPLCLFVRGGADTATTRARLSAIVDAPLVAVVGTRTPSPYGEDMARSIGGGLARAGLVVVSGLAMGIDAVAQAAAVDAIVDPPSRAAVTAQSRPPWRCSAAAPTSSTRAATRASTSGSPAAASSSVSSRGACRRGPGASPPATA